MVNRNGKRLSCLLLVFFMFTSMCVLGSDEKEETASFLLNTVPDPQVGSVGGEWVVLGLARWLHPEDYQEYFEQYYKNAERYVRECRGILHDKKYTEYSRVVLAMTAIGKDPREVAGYDLIKPLEQFEMVSSQGCNGAAFALLALDCGGYLTDSDVREKYVNFLVSSQGKDGSFSLDGTGDVDLTAMVLTALSPYQETAGETINSGLAFLSEKQLDNGGFESRGTENAESCAQVIVALSALGIAMDDSRFVKNGMTPYDNLISFLLPEGGFVHTKEAKEPSLMTTEQAFYALVALERAEQGKCPLYDMRDVVPVGNSTEISFGLPEKDQAVTYRPITVSGKTFSDIADHPAKKEIEALASREIISGKTEDAFEPDSTMTRAEFACIVVRALGLETALECIFDDVPEQEWYCSYISTAYRKGLVSGVSNTEFYPEGTITREEAAAMVSRGAKLCGMNTELSQEQILDVLSQFEDYKEVSNWAQASLAFCYEKEILSQDMLLIQPDAAVKRYEIAQMLYQMMECANLLQ